MKTDDLITLLARNAGPAPRAAVARRVAPVALAGLLVSILLVRLLHEPMPRELLDTPAPWIKLAYAGALALSAGWLTARLARPVARLAVPTAAVLTVLLVMTVLGLAAWLSVPAPDRMEAVMGSSWSTCPWSVLALSLPTLAGSLWAVRGLAPTRPRAAGFACGLLAGALGAVGYAMACPELSAAFIAVWYSLGILLSGALGALLGPRVLRW